MNDITDRIDIENLLHDNESRHSDFQIDNFIIKKQGDSWAQYKQCLREISSRHESIKNNEAKAKAIKSKIRKTVRFKIWRLINRKKIAGNSVEFDQPEMLKTTKNLKAELECFLKRARELKKVIGEITPEKRYELETESWKAKALKMAVIDVLSTGRISNQTYEFIFSLPKESQLEIFVMLSCKQPMEVLGFEPDEVRAIARK